MFLTFLHRRENRFLSNSFFSFLIKMVSHNLQFRIFFLSIFNVKINSDFIHNIYNIKNREERADVL